MKNNIIASFHHSFAGGSKNTSRLLHFLSQNGFSIKSLHYEMPQFFTYTSSNVDISLFDHDSLKSEVITALPNYNLVEQIIRVIEEKNGVLLYGANLFPYCDMLLQAKQQYKTITDISPKLIIQPVGSDIWQIGPTIKSRVKWLLDNEEVNAVCCYSSSFADEITQYYDIKRNIDIVPPVLETNRFFPLTANEKSKRRISLGFTEDDFIIHHHSSMRRVKCPHTVISIAVQVSKSIKQKCVLIMEGPIPHAVLNQNSIKVHTISQGSFIASSYIEGLTVLWTGLSNSVEYIMQVADIELNASLHDSFNIALLEAMACGIPVVSSNIVGIKDHIEASGGGYCFPTTRLSFDEINQTIENKAVESLFNKNCAVDYILSCADNHENAAKIGKLGSDYVYRFFAPEQIINTFYNVIYNHA